MQKTMKLLFLVIVLISLSACGGDVSKLQIIDKDSQLYSKEEIDEGIQTIVREFDKNWDGCTLTEIYYAGDRSSKEYSDWAKRNDVDQVMVLLSSFDVDSSGGGGSLNPNSTYSDWMWILVREKGGSWKHVDHGY